MFGLGHNHLLVFTVLTTILEGCHLTSTAHTSDLTSNVTFHLVPTAQTSTTDSKKAKRQKRQQMPKFDKQAAIGTYILVVELEQIRRKQTNKQTRN